MAEEAAGAWTLDVLRGGDASGSSPTSRWGHAAEVMWRLARPDGGPAGPDRCFVTPPPWAPARATMVVYGGYDNHYSSDVHTLRLGAGEGGLRAGWRRPGVAEGDAPTQRSNATLTALQALDSGACLVVFGGGGERGAKFNDTWLLVNVGADGEPERWAWCSPAIRGPRPSQRSYHASARVCPSLLATFGGHDGSKDLRGLFVMRLLKVSAGGGDVRGAVEWRQIRRASDTTAGGAWPAARRFHAMSSHDGRRCCVMFGGCYGTAYTCLNDTWMLVANGVDPAGAHAVGVDEESGSTRWQSQASTAPVRWVSPQVSGAPPEARWGHSLVACGDSAVCFGGRHESDLRDVHVLTILGDAAVAWSTPDVGPGPRARRRHTAVAAGGDMIVFGGFNGEFLADCHSLSVAAAAGDAAALETGVIDNSSADRRLSGDASVPLLGAGGAGGAGGAVEYDPFGAAEGGEGHSDAEWGWGDGGGADVEAARRGSFAESGGEWAASVSAAELGVAGPALPEWAASATEMGFSRGHVAAGVAAIKARGAAEQSSVLVSSCAALRRQERHC